jgi:hypothetical protein
MPHVPHHSDDGAPARRKGLDVRNGIESYALTDGIRVRPEAPRKIRIHYRD